MLTYVQYLSGDSIAKNVNLKHDIANDKCSRSRPSCEATVLADITCMYLHAVKGYICVVCKVTCYHLSPVYMPSSRAYFSITFLRNILYLEIRLSSGDISYLMQLFLILDTVDIIYIYI